VPTSPVLAQVPPLGIPFFDQRELPRSRPALDLLLSRNRDDRTVCLLEEDQPVASVTLREARGQAGLVFEDPPLKVVGDADVERAATAGDDVGPVRAHTWSCREGPSARSQL